MNFKYYSFLLIPVLIPLTCISQEAGYPSLEINKAEDKIIIDGQMTELSWEYADAAEEFMQYYPFDSSKAMARTEIRMTYDDENLYIIAKLYDDLEGGYITPSLRRDYRGSANDGISIIFDPFQDNTNAFMFGLNPFGVQREALISGGGSGRNTFDLSWDNKWYASSKIYDGYWIGEIAIPFKTLRFNEGSDLWNVNFYRIDSKYNERSTWTPIPRQFTIFNLAYMGKLKWDNPPEKPGANISLIPYTTAQVTKDFETGEDTEFSADFGGDAKIAVTPSLNLDLTINPDFSQVEVDRQVTNLSRFEIFFPERRQFFLENADIFSDLGFPNIRPFFSRRIGIAEDTAAGENVENRILYGARLSGKINRDWRLGVLNMQTAKDEEINLPGFNYSVATFQRRIFKRSNIGAFIVNKQSFSDDLESDSIEFNRVFGVDFNLASADNKWRGDIFYHKSVNPYRQKDDFAHGAFFGFNTLKYSFRWAHQIVGENYEAQVGFVPRTDFRRISPNAGIRFYPQSSKINNHGPEMEFELIWNDSLGRTDHKIELRYELNFLNTSSLRFNFVQEYTFLFNPFDPTNTDETQLPAGSDYNYNSYLISFRSDTRKPFFYELNTLGGEFFNGTRYGIRGELNYRYQPYGIFSLNFNYNSINLPEPYADANLLLIGPRLDFTFTKSIFLTAFFQYNNQIDNFNINTRFQWRFKPVSDIFLVYTDNYNTSNFEVKNRAIVLKVTYWLNL